MPVRISASLEITNGQLVTVSRSGSLSEIAVVGNDYVQATQNIGTAAERIDSADLSTAGYAWFKNVSGGVTPPIISLRMGQNGVDFVNLRSGEIALCRLADNDLFAISSANGGRLEYLIVEG